MAYIKNKALKPVGAVDRVHQGWLHGWYASSDKADENSFTLLIDGQPQGIFQAETYRPDLAALNIRDGRVGFHIPVPLNYLDDKQHLIGLAPSANDKSTINVELRLTSPDGLKKTIDSILWYQHSKTRSIKKIALYATYTQNEELYRYHRKTITALQDAGYHVVLIVSVDDNAHPAPNLFAGEANTVILRRNLGYDFGSWATGIWTIREITSQIQHLLLLNDSIVGPLGNLQPMLEAFEKSQSDFWGVCNSFDRRHHIQSFCYGFHAKLLKSPYVPAFFLYNEPVKDKSEAIENFELKMSRFFANQGFNINHWLDYQQLANDFIKDILAGYKPEQSQGKSNLRYFHNRLVTINFEAFITNTISHIENGTPLNPTHYFWREILKREFPFIKKELLTVNPENNPMLVYDYGGWLDQHSDSAQLISELFERQSHSYLPGLLNFPS